MDFFFTLILNVTLFCHIHTQTRTITKQVDYCECKVTWCGDDDFFSTVKWKLGEMFDSPSIVFKCLSRVAES